MRFIKKTLEFLAEGLGLKQPDLSGLVAPPFTETVVLPIDSLRYSPSYQHQVFAPKVRAMELVIHLRNKYGDDWKDYIDEIHGETDEVTGLLPKLEYEIPDVSMTRDNVPELFDGFHTICAYKKSGYCDVRVLLGERHTKTSTELGLRPLDELEVDPHL